MGENKKNQGDSFILTQQKQIEKLLQNYEIQEENINLIDIVRKIK